MREKDYLTERIGARVEEDVFKAIIEVSKRFNIKPTEVLREIVHEAIRENHMVIKRGSIQKLNGIDKF